MKYPLSRQRNLKNAPHSESAPKTPSSPHTLSLRPRLFVSTSPQTENNQNQIADSTGKSVQECVLEELLDWHLRSVARLDFELGLEDVAFPEARPTQFIIPLSASVYTIPSLLRC